MTLNKRTRDEMRALCGEIHEDDGVDHREYFKSRKPRDKKCRKAMQLCHQVKVTLDLLLSGEFNDELLHNLQVISVTPAPDDTQLAVLLKADLPAEQIDTQKILARLATVTGLLRSEVASAITRKRAPKLMFHLAGPTETEEVQP